MGIVSTLLSCDRPSLVKLRGKSDLPIAFRHVMFTEQMSRQLCAHRTWHRTLLLHLSIITSSLRSTFYIASTITDTCYMHEAKTAQISNFWTFWPGIHLIDHLLTTLFRRIDRMKMEFHFNPRNGNWGLF